MVQHGAQNNFSSHCLMLAATWTREQAKQCFQMPVQHCRGHISASLTNEFLCFGEFEEVLNNIVLEQFKDMPSNKVNIKHNTPNKCQCCKNVVCSTKQKKKGFLFSSNACFIFVHLSSPNNNGRSPCPSPWVMSSSL